MVDFLRDFIKVLRLSDVRVSSSETIDAMKVSSLIGLEDKNLLKQSLSQSLAKSMRCLLYTSPSPRDRTRSRMPSSA